MSVRLNKPFLFSILALAVTAVLVAVIILPSKQDSDKDTESQVIEENPPASLRTAGCVQAAPASLSTQAIEEMRLRARDFAARQLHQDALAEYHKIAAIDPGFPGLNLDTSMSLLQLKRVDEARTAIDTQIGISDCLAKMPMDQFAAYCRAEVFHGDMDGCRQQMQDILRSAHMQAALIHMELGHGPLPSVLTASAPQTTIAPQTKSVPQTPSAPRTATSSSLKTLPLMPHASIPQVHTAGTVKRPADRALALGAGTDAELGAYSK